MKWEQGAAVEERIKETVRWGGHTDSQNGSWKGISEGVEWTSGAKLGHQEKGSGLRVGSTSRLYDPSKGVRKGSDKRERQGAAKKE